MSPGDLAHVLRHLDAEPDPRLLVGPSTFDDAGVVRFADGRALVQTVDFFPPIVDDPYAYGAIAAANSLSDVYAMGGRPVSALNVAGFPEGFDPDVIGQILRGAADKVKEAGALTAGGHTIRSETILFGLAVTGEVDPEKVVSNANARPGDLLYLTKPLGMGAASTAIKKQSLSEADIRAAEKQMATLNAGAAEAMVACGAHACTDVTGFGLLGHAKNVAAASDMCLVFEAARIPIFPPAEALARKGIFSGGAARSRKDLEGLAEVAPEIPEWKASLCFDSETSGGLLIAVPEGQAEAIEVAFRERGVPGERVGRVEAFSGLRIRLNA